MFIFSYRQHVKFVPQAAAAPHLPSRFSMASIATLAALYLTLMFNTSLFQALLAAHQARPLQQILFITTSGLMVFIIALMTIATLSFRASFKAWLVFLLLSGSLANFFMNHYHVVINQDMVNNLLQTDWEEAYELLSLSLAVNVLLFGLLPATLVLLLPVRYPKPLAGLGLQAATLGVGLALILGLAFSQYQDYASVFRNNRELRYLVVPSGYLYAISSLAQQSFKTKDQGIRQLGQDAHKGQHWSHLNGRKNLLVLVVGETARAQNFSLGGYSRDTNPNLAHEQVIYFDNVHACGTSTAVSVPCMFSPYGRSNYDENRIKHSENLLDVLHNAGVNVLWRDNNSGCKGVCDRVQQEDLSKSTNPELCNEHECFDMVLLDQLQDRIEQMPDGGVLVLHQKGSHGPGYFLRSPLAFKHFTPECHNVELQQCSQAEIQNAYDNTILYTDHVLGKLIDFLKLQDDRYNSALLYVSDHGESLSEGNLYLHGIPYQIAPDEQTHVPLLLWLSNHYAKQMDINPSCLQQQARLPFSHDNLFDTILDLADVQTQLHHRQQSIVSPCMGKQAHINTTAKAKPGEAEADDAGQT